jgi:UDP-N-acetylmuramoyl-L-alanyl-D-glutamate--2,6-diaminopimelate ligase
MIDIKTNTLQDGLKFEYKNNHYSCPALLGSYNAENIAMAIDICLHLGLEQEQIKRSLSAFPGIPGRMQKHVLKNSATAIVDYAHNATSMEAVLSTLRPMTEDLIVIFGCGGNRDKTRRPTMGAVAAQCADTIILTDDNPRFEDRQDIADDILSGIAQEQRHKVTIELDRAQAIKLGATMSTSKSIIALLGKGHETSYIVKDKIKQFDDFEEIKKY